MNVQYSIILSLLAIAVVAAPERPSQEIRRQFNDLPACENGIEGPDTGIKSSCDDSCIMVEDADNDYQGQNCLGWCKSIPPTNPIGGFWSYVCIGNEP